jgi:hypothetical protein
VRGYGTGWNFHYTVNTIKSVTVYNDELKGTKHDIESTDAYTIIMKMQPAIRAQLEVDLDGDGINDHWAGYIYFDQTAPIRNQMIGQTLILNLQAGQAAGANTWMKEINNLAAGTVMVDNNNLELWSADSLAMAEQLVDQVAVFPAGAFGLYPRFYINDANTGQTCLMIWKSANWPLIPYVHVNIYNDEEKPVSGNIPLPYELNIICLDPDYLPNLWTGYPKEGWIALEFPDISGAGFFGDLEWAGYTWTYATGPPSESWNYLTQIHRDVEHNGFGWDEEGL